MSDATNTGPVLSADGVPLKRSLAKALRREKLRALMLIAPLLIFVLITFIAPIADMLFRSVENNIVEDTIPRTVLELKTWNPDDQDLPPQQLYREFFFDVFLAAEAKQHTRLGSRLNYEKTGISSAFRSTGRRLDDIGDLYKDPMEDLDKSWDEAAFWYELMSGSGASDSALLEEQRSRVAKLTQDSMSGDIGFVPGAEISELLPRTAREYTAFAIFTNRVDEKVVAEEEPWEAVHAALGLDLQEGAASRVANYSGPGAEQLATLADNLDILPVVDFREAFIDINKDWGDPEVWGTTKVFSGEFTSGYFLNSVDLQKSPDGIEQRDEDQRIYVKLFGRTLFMSLTIMFSCVLLGYPVAFILANLPVKTSNLLLILVLLPFWTSLLVRTSAWKILLQQEGVINDILVWIGLVDDANRLVMINNQFGTIVAMTHILLPFMILPLYSVMQTIPVTYVRAAKSLGATNWTAFWRVYFPQSIPGIGAGCILVFILSIGYYITPELVGGTKGVFISNRIAYHISSSLNWGLGAALGTILLAVVLILYWAYDKIVGIDNVKLG
jgi:putative spermidine/putrescine transport system permease protein